jgi:hypothetical protein
MATPAATPAPGALQLAEANIRLPQWRRCGRQEPGVGRVHFEQQLESAKLGCALRIEFGADAPRIQQFHRARQAVTPPRQCLHLNAQGTQALHAFPHGRTAHTKFPRQRFAGVQPAVRQQHQQQRGI